LNDNTSNAELENDSTGVEPAKFVDFTVHAREKVSEGFTDSHDESKEFSGGVEALSVHLGAHVDFNELSS
jgi:hypothetical protein